MQIIHSKLLNNYPELIHGFTTKSGGVSKTPFCSLNLAFHVGDEAKSVHKNHLLLAKELGYEKNRLIHMKQIHSDLLYRVKENDTFENPPSCDALITDKTDTPLMVMVADCAPILFYDSVQKVIAVAHAGRAGAFKNIVHNVIESFVKDFYSEPKDIEVVVGATIGVCCYEVGSEIYEEAKALDLDYAIQKRGSSYYLDVAAILHNQLKSANIQKENIEFLDTCSCCENAKHFSYRAHGVTGRFCGVISLKSY